jgi:hypothetical protein
VKVADKEQEVPNPLHAEWIAREQQVLSYLLLSSSRDVLTQVISIPSPLLCGNTSRACLPPSPVRASSTRAWHWLPRRRGT